jgi:hypothetical protein
MVIKKDIIYPIFIECLKFCENKFWSSIFEDMAYGKTPHGTYIHKNFFCCNYKGKEFSYKIEEIESENIYNDIFSLLTKKLKILSEEDRKNQILDFIKIENEMNEQRFDKWSSIKKKSTKDSLIENFIIEKKRNHDLSDKQVKNLQKQINLGLIFKTISHKDIILKDGRIEKINDLEFSKKDFKINRDLIRSEELETNVEQSSEISKLSDIYKKIFFKNYDVNDD